MLNKFSCLCLIIITINAVFNPALTWADVNKNLKNNIQNRQDTSTSGSRLFNDATNAWQPYIPNHNWLPQPLTFTPTMSKSTATTAATTTTTTSTPLMQNSKYKQHIHTHRNHHTHHYSTHYDKQEQKQQQQQQQQKNHVNMPKLISSQIPPTDKNSLTTSIGALKAATRASSSSNIEKSFNSHESWLLYNGPKDIISEANNSQRSQQWQMETHPQKKKTSTLSELHLPQATDIEEKNYRYHQHYASTIGTDAMHPKSKYPINVNDIQQQKYMSLGSLNPLSNLNASNKTDTKMKNLNINNILTKASQQNFKTNDILNDNVDVPNHVNDADDDEPFSRQPNVLKTVTTSSHHGGGKYLNLKLTLLKKILNNNPTLYDNSNDIHIIPCDNKRKRESDRHGNDDDTSYSYSKKDKIDKVNDLKIITPHHLVVKSSLNTTAAAAPTVATETRAMEKHVKLIVKEIQQPVGEVQGRKTQIAKDVVKHAFMSATPQVMNKSMSAAIDKHVQRRIWNVLATPQTTLPSASMVTSTSKSLSSEIVSGRKVKKVKKKLKKFLLPLLLAYKLKFITLLPLLVGGLVLLVGTTGMAGFFFALFMAVMSLKSSSRNAVVVKKY